MAETRLPLAESAVSITAYFRIEVRERTQHQARNHPHLTRLYFLTGDLTGGQVTRLASELLADPVTETCTVHFIDSFSNQPVTTTHFIEVTLLLGVTDTVADNLVRAAHQIGIHGLQAAATGQRYDITEPQDTRTPQEWASSLFNPVIQRATINEPITPPFVTDYDIDLAIDIIPLRDADDPRLLHVNAERRLALDLEELRAIRAYFRDEGRDPTDAELEMLAQTWSEHCVHKTFKALIDYTGPDGTTQPINGLLKSYIRAATEQLDKAWVRSAFVDNAGIIAFDDSWDIAFKVETHNHPSALEPFGGANTGLGGVIRDVLGVSARPIASTDVLCFGPPDLPAENLPVGVLHPTRIAAGVVHGIEDYGNKMGIPTVNGAVFYHESYTANPLVFCGCLGLLPRDSHPVGARPGDLIVVIGGRTGRDGLRGATFSSMEMDATTGTVAGSAVQIGHPIQEKQVQEAILRLRDEQLYHAITDCGAGGLSSAVGEMAAGLGANVQLDKAPLKYAGLQPWEIWLSEAQERMVLAVSPEHWARVQAICAGQNVEATCIGTFEASGRLYLAYEGHRVGDLSVDFLHDGIPHRRLKAEWKSSPNQSSTLYPVDPAQALLDLLAHPNIRSKESIIRRYDHEVLGGTAVKPLTGLDNHGPSDAAVIAPADTLTNDTPRGVALSAGMCPQYSAHDPYAMAWAAVDEAFRNLVATGADPDQVALLDNFCWGNPLLPDRLGALVRCAQGCYDAALAYRAPFISGKDSLNNEYTGADGQRHAIPGTLLISGLGIVPDVRHAMTSDLKRAGSLLYLLGTTRDEFGGSHYALLQNAPGGSVPQPSTNALDLMRRLHQAIAGGHVLACHDCSEGGLAVALAEMSIGGRLGVAVELGDGDATTLLFSESLSRFVIEVDEEHRAAFEARMTGLPLIALGSVTNGGFELRQHDQPVLSLSLPQIERAWRGEYQPSQAHIIPHTITRRSTAVGSKHVLILHANGSNRDHEAALACQMTGAQAEIVHVNQLRAGEKDLLDFHMLIVPGGFSYGDDLGAGRLWALDLQHHFAAQLERFVNDGRPVLGICNGFQALVKAGLLPGENWQRDGARAVTLTYNEAGRFECRWVYLQPTPDSPCLFTEGLTDPIYCPVAHGEGRLSADDATLDAIWSQGLAALTYANADGTPAAYPFNPNGSALGIAGLCNAQGNVFGLMPHPENHIFDWQHPRYRRGERGLDGLRLFQNGLRHA